MGTRIKTRITPKIRVMSFVIAFVILVVSLPIWIGNTGTKVKATYLTGDGNHIYSDTKTTTMTAMGNGQASANDNRFVYTGKITKAQTELFDYVSDYELINNSYNNILHTEGGYDDAYTSFNNAISQSDNATTPLHAYNDNITITLQTTSFSDRVFIYLFKSSDSSYNNGWPGKQMTYDSANNRYTYTFSRSSTNTSSPYWLNFTPNSIIFTDGTNTNTVKSRTISQNMTKGNTYSFVETNPESNKIKYEYKTGWESNFWLYCWENDITNNGWPGGKMTWDSNSQTYKYEYDTTNSIYPKKFLIDNKGDGGDNDWKSNDLPYSEMNEGNTRKGFTYYCYWNSNLAVDEYLNSTFSLSDSSQQAQPIYSTKYTNPLYFGCFWRSNSADTIANNSNNPGYNISNKAAYNNFWWQANIGLKNTGTTANDDPSETDTTGFRVRGTASTQGLVYSSLSVNDNLVDVNGTTELPYFDKTSSLVTSGLMKYYDKDETGDNIHFPFYEVKADAQSYVGNGNSEKKIAGEYKVYSGSGTATTQFAKFYQFDSKESNVRFEIKDNDPSLHKGHFVETSKAITHDGKAGYFPFNNINTNNEKKHNLGVGTKFEMTFKLQPDGCVGVVDSSGNDLDTNDYKTRVHTIFEFEGDDDLWVFIDGNLVLDMGGAHFKSHGVIDFADQTATVDKAITIGDHRAGYTGNAKDDLGVDYTSNAQISNTTPSTDYFKNRLKSGSFRTVTLEGGETREEYDPNVSHKITVFYMERGMLDSNLLIRFNYSPEANFSKMKIAEVTDYSAINTGLQTFFQEAAENDVFMYTVENKGTKKADVLTNSAAYPTNENRTRKNEGENTVQEKLAVYDSNANPEPILYTSPGHVDPNDSTKWIDDTGKWSNVSGTSYLWVDGFTYNDSNASASKLVGKTSGTGDPNGTKTGGELFLMYGTCNNLYPPAGTEKEGKESSAEFEKTFTRDSIMKITQSNDLHKPTRTVSDGVLQVENFQTDSGRDVNQYYTTAVRLVDRDSHVNATLLDSNEDTITTPNPTLENGGMFKFNNASSVDATSSVMLTEYFVNTPKMGAITIKKELDSSQHDNADLVGEFTFKLYLENVFGINGVNVVNSTAKDKGYNKIDVTRLDKNNSSSTYTGYKMTATDGENYGEFKLKAGETLTINNIPYNTSYSIVEVSSTHDPKTPDTQYTTGNVLEGTLNNNKSAKLNASTGNYDENTANNATIVNTRLTGELKFQKTLGTYAAENGITGSSEFVYHVVLTAPSGVDLTKYISSSDVTALDASGVLQSGTCTFNVTVTANDDPLKSLSGIPYGTTFSVSEDSTSSAGTIGSLTPVVTETNSDPANTIDEAETTVTITNNYPAVLSLQKAVTGDAPIPSETFTFNVKLTGLTGTPTIKKVVTDENSVTTETVIDNPADFDVDIKSTDTVKITGIPKNTTYTVSEPDQPENWSIDNSNSTGLTGTFDNAAITTIPTAKITNTYTKPRKILTLQKVDSSRNNALVTFSDASKGAQFVLMRLSKTLNAETLDWTDSSTLSAFETVINDDSYTPTTGDYVAMVYDNSGSNYSTGTSGQFDITESASFEFEDYYYFFYEVTAPNGYQKNNSVTGKVFQVVEQETVVAYPNMPDSTDVTAKKEDQDTGTGLPGAEFDLYYKPDAKRTTYTINESETTIRLYRAVKDM